VIIHNNNVCDYFFYFTSRYYTGLLEELDGESDEKKADMAFAYFRRVWEDQCFFLIPSPPTGRE